MLIKYYIGTLAFLIGIFLLPSDSRSQNTILEKACVDCHGSETKYPVRGVRSNT